MASSVKASMAERLIRTLKERIWRHFCHTGKKRWVDVLDDIVYSYNHTRHRTIGRCPADVNKSNETIVWQYVYGTENDKVARPPKLVAGDAVRVTKGSRAFKKGYTGNWSSEIFCVHSRVHNRTPFMYILKDGDDEILKGAFYENELQKVIPQKDLAVFEKVLKTKGTKPNRFFLVKWKGKPMATASWVHEKSIL